MNTGPSESAAETTLVAEEGAARGGDASADAAVAPPPGRDAPLDDVATVQHATPPDGPTPGGILLRAALLMFVALGVVLVVNLLRRPAFFRVEARTEMLDVALRPSSSTRLADLHWTVAGDSVLVDDEIVFPFHGRVVPGAGARLVMRRAGTGPLYVEAHASGDTSIAAALYADDDLVATAHTVFVLRGDADDERTYTMPYFGAASVGDVVSAGGRELLLDGAVSMIGSTRFGDDRFVAGTIALRMGDQVEIAAAGAPAACGRDYEPAPGIGVARADAAPGLLVVHEAHGAALRVSRVGTTPHCFRASLWSFFSADPLLGAMLLFAAGVVIAVVQNLISYTLLDTRAFLRARSHVTSRIRVGQTPRTGR